MQEKTKEPGQGDTGGGKQWPQEETGKQGGQGGDIGKKGGAPLENPNIEGPTDVPDEGSDVRKPPA